MMDKIEYIERKAAIKAVCNSMTHICRLDDCGKGCQEVSAIISIPAADVRPVVHGEWKDAMQSCHDSPHVKCSVCGEYYWRYFKKFNFCPNCGAMMEES